MTEHEQEDTVAVPAAALDALMRAYQAACRTGIHSPDRQRWEVHWAHWGTAAVEFCAAVLPTWQPQPETPASITCQECGHAYEPYGNLCPDCAGYRFE